MTKAVLVYQIVGSTDVQISSFERVEDCKKVVNFMLETNYYRGEIMYQNIMWNKYNCL